MSASTQEEGEEEKEREQATVKWCKEKESLCGYILKIPYEDIKNVEQENKTNFIQNDNMKLQKALKKHGYNIGPKVDRCTDCGRRLKVMFQIDRSKPTWTVFRYLPAHKKKIKKKKMGSKKQ